MEPNRAVDSPGDGRIVGGRDARLWWEFADRIVRDHRDLLDATNVFPVADGDTGTNLTHTLGAIAAAVAGTEGADAAAVLRAAARASALGARGNSGILISLFLAGMAANDAAANDAAAGIELAAGLRAAAARMRSGLAQPAEGTILSVAEAAADGAADRVTGALAAARAALIDGPQRLPVLAGAGVVDAGGLALVLILEALAAALADSPDGLCDGAADCPHAALARHTPQGAPDRRPVAPCDSVPAVAAVPRFEVMYRVTATAAAVETLFGDLDRLGDSVAMVALDADAHVAHVHTDVPGAAVEAGIRAGGLADIRIEVLPPEPSQHPESTETPEPAAPSASPDRPDSAGSSVVLAFVVGAGCARLFASAGALAYRLDRRDGLREVAALLDERPADRVLVLPNGLLGNDRVARVAHLIRERGAAVDLLWSASTVQGLAALSVHDPQRSPAEDLYALSAAVAGTRWGTITRSRTRVLTGIGLAEAGRVLARLGVEVVAIGSDPVLVTCRLLDRFLDTGGEVVTVLSGLAAPPGLESGLRRHLEAVHPGVEVTVLDGGMPDDMVAVGVE
ncbi:DAK2 domain-containing protein [Millisia brevis]|uniref:DAK2 domain-containing protein n=1 Tax=Millisia brevis TaxID=264148 RepID=UPI00082FCD95|nr:DAK2 domain-containing protein [Millisia brevis]